MNVEVVAGAAEDAAKAKAVVDVLREFEHEFSAVAVAAENGEFALWVGSGISRNAPNLGGLVARAVEFLRLKSRDPAEKARFEPAFAEALKLAETTVEAVAIHLEQPFLEWPENLRGKIIERLWGRYSALLDIRIENEADDYMLWVAVDARSAFANLPPPMVEHLCIAILILEGALKEIASANWDGFIESAVESLGPGIAGNLQVVVDPNHLRDPPAKAQLLKFHGCIVHASQNEGLYRKFLTGSETQITNWATEPLFKPMVRRIVEIATNKKALMVGISLQDANLQSIFAAARQANPWPWPCAPNAQGHVFCEERGLGEKQKAMLKTVYRDNYNANIGPIQKSALLRFWPEQVLLALVLHLISEKLAALLRWRIEGTSCEGQLPEFTRLLRSLRNAIAASVTGDHTDFARWAISVWARVVRLFRDGIFAGSPSSYEVISTNTAINVANDMNARAAGFGELAIILALIEHCRTSSGWRVSPPSESDLAAGTLLAAGSYTDAVPRTIFLVRSAREALELQKAGAYANDNVLVIHGDDVWHALHGSGDESIAAGGARMPRRAPGRTGRARTHDVSLKGMLENATSLDDLKRRFETEIVL